MTESKIQNCIDIADSATSGQYLVLGDDNIIRWSSVNEYVIAYSKGNEWFLNTASAEEIDKILNPKNSISCGHAWKLYEGFTNRYEYCSKCDLRRQMVRNKLW